MAVFNERDKCQLQAAPYRVSVDVAAICLTMALPTITPSAMAETLAASSGVCNPETDRHRNAGGFADFFDVLTDFQQVV